MTTDKQELQRLCDAASPGPWTAYGCCVEGPSLNIYDEGGHTEADAEFIAAARTAIPTLLAELAAVTAERDALKAQVPEGMLRVELTLSDRSISRLIHVAQIETSNTNEVERYANQCWRELSAAKEGDAR